jgi:hypothetical protein
LLCLVAPPLAAEVPRAVPPRPGWLIAAILGSEALHAGPGFDQRAINREVLTRKQPLHLWGDQDSAQESAGNVAFEQPLTVLGKHRHVPDRGVHGQTDKPAEQHIVGQLLHQLPLRAHRVERLQEQRPQQLLRGDRGSTRRGIELREVG